MLKVMFAVELWLLLGYLGSGFVLRELTKDNHKYSHDYWKEDATIARWLILAGTLTAFAGLMFITEEIVKKWINPFRSSPPK